MAATLLAVEATTMGVRRAGVRRGWSVCAWWVLREARRRGIWCWWVWERRMPQVREGTGEWVRVRV